MGKSMEVVLLEDVADLGRSGDTCRVKAGYARNYLLPKKLAVLMTPGTKRLIEKKRAEAVERLAREKTEAEALRAKLETMTLTCTVKTTPEGRLFGSVSAADILAQLAKEGIVLQKRQLAMYEPFKSLGEHQVTLHLHPEVRGKLNVKIVAEKTAEATADAG